MRHIIVAATIGYFSFSVTVIRRDLDLNMAAGLSWYMICSGDNNIGVCVV